MTGVTRRRRAIFIVFLEDPLWVGILEIVDEQGVRAARHVLVRSPGGRALGVGFSRDYARLVRRAPSNPISSAAAESPRWYSKLPGGEPMHPHDDVVSGGAGVGQVRQAESADAGVTVLSGDGSQGGRDRLYARYPA